MVLRAKTLDDARDYFCERLAILRKSRALYVENKHRSLRNRGPYIYALKVAQQEFDTAKLSLERALNNIRKSQQLRELRRSIEDGLSRIKLESDPQAADRSPDLHQQQREFLYKLEQADELEKELTLQPK